MNAKAFFFLYYALAQTAVAAPTPSYEELIGIVLALQSEVKELSAEVKSLKSKNQPTTLASSQTKAAEAISASAPNIVAEGAAKDTFRLPSSKTSLGFGGFIKLDAISSSISMGENKSSNQYLSAGAIPVGDERKGLKTITTIHPRESRIWFKSSTPVNEKALSTYLETDFFVSGDSVVDAYRPRIRHAYATYEGIIAGQTWSTFTNIDAYPESLDFGSKIGAALSFAPMLGWRGDAQAIGLPLWLQVALEDPKTSVIKASDASTYAQSFSSLPDFLLRASWKPEWGELSLAALAKQLRISENGNTREKAGGGASLTGKINYGQDGDNLRFGISYGNAIGRYAANGVFADAVIDNEKKLHSLPITAVYAAMQHWWTPTLRTNIIANIAQANNPSFITPNASKKATAWHINLLYNHIPQVLFGAELMYAVRELENGQEGDLKRFQLTTRFNF